MDEVTVTHSDGRKEVWSVYDMGEERFARTNHRYAIECEGGTGLVAMIEGMGDKYRRRANLIAAAPELLGALKALLDAIERTPCSCIEAYTGRGLTDPSCIRCGLDLTTEEMDAARDAIAKAEATGLNRRPRPMQQNR